MAALLNLALPNPAARRLTLRPGEYFAGRGNTLLHTLLGSCVSIILWQPALRVGATSHFMLGARQREPDTPLDARYGEEAMQLMVQDLALHHVRARDCQARLVGGGDMFPNGMHVMDIGRRNGEAARQLLHRHGIAPCPEHLFGQGHRQVLFNLNTGEVRVRQTPVVICSTLTEKGARVTLDALAAGAVAVVEKPRLGLRQFLADSAAELVATVRAAARANVRRIPAPAAAPTPRLSSDAVLPAAEAHAPLQTTERVVAIGASTGGTQALEEVLTSLPRVCPGMVIVQHMPEKFIAAFAARVDSISRIEVREARSGERMLPGRALIAPGGRHMTLKRNGAQYMVDVMDGPLVNRHRPSVDVLFRSVARHAGANALGIIMTAWGTMARQDCWRCGRRGRGRWRRTRRAAWCTGCLGKRSSVEEWSGLSL